MSDTKPIGDAGGFSARRLRELTAALCDDRITAAEQSELEQILLSAESARSQFLADMCVHAGLEWDMAAREKLESLLASGRGCVDGGSSGERLHSHRVNRAPITSGRRRLAIVAAAACVVAASAIVLPGAWRLWNAGRSADVARNDAQGPASAQDQPIIASIAAASDDCDWMFEKQSIDSKLVRDDRSKVRTGDTLRVTSGTARLTFDRGTAVTLSAPSILEIISPMRGRLIRGRATVDVSIGSEGFTIDTPRTSVVDLGTVFGVEVDDFGRTDVVVFSGKVDVMYSSDVMSTTNTEVGTQRLYMGEALRVDYRGTLSRIVSLTSDRFPGGRAVLVAPSRAPVISSVRDNIEREGAWFFYEIVPEGMREDAKAFVDRLHHEWNGVEPDGMPEYLIGGDYVKTFNDDKNAGNMEISVTLAEPAMLYVLWCKRIPVPDWLHEEFVDTGDEIGVDEGHHVFRDGTTHERDGPRVGPGISVDSIHSIWRRKVSEPSTIRLGPTEAPGWDFNVYGIVAVPLQKAEK